MKKLGLVVFVLCTLGMYAQSEISGTVTYYFNENYGFKPDVGAKVFLVDSIGYNNIENSKELEQWQSVYLKREATMSAVSNYPKMIESNKKMIEMILISQAYRRAKYQKEKVDRKGKKGKKYDEITALYRPFALEISWKEEDIKSYEEKYEDAQEDLILFNTEDYNNFYDKCTIAYRILKSYVDNEGLEIRTVDGSGRYSFRGVENGTYYLVFDSSHRTSLSAIEVRKVIVKRKYIDVSIEF